MDIPTLFPLHEDSNRLLRHAKLLPHVGIGTIASHGSFDHPIVKKLQELATKINGKKDSTQFDVTCVMPASGDCLLILNTAENNSLSRDFGKGLSVTGQSPDGEFRLDCPDYVVGAISETSEKPGWAIGSPVNGPLSITYGDSRPISKVFAIINNFDFDRGNVGQADSQTGVGEILRVTAAGRTVDFKWRDDRTQLRTLLAVAILPTTALTQFSFDAWPGASEKELIDFAWDVAGLCSIVVKQHTWPPVVSFLDSDGKVAKRVVGNPIESKFRTGSILRSLSVENSGMPQVFCECFEEFSKLRRTPLWQQFPAFCAGIDDPPYFEQKISTLMSAIERLLRNSLLEANKLTTAEEQRMTLPDLIGSARSRLGWDIPSHYTAKESYRNLRNAVSHGNSLPNGAQENRREFDKWHLFFVRRLLMRLGYKGQVYCPQRGFACSSPVDNFSEEFNSFAI